MNDLFIDNNITKNFANPLDEEYKKLIRWLDKYDKNSNENAILVVCNKLLGEYGRTSALSTSPTNIWALIDKMTRQGRLHHIKNDEIKEFKREYFKKKVIRRLKCNGEDREFIPVVLLSCRQFALVRDEKFKNDLNNFKGFNARAVQKPQDLPYDR